MIGALVALLAAILAYGAVRAQIIEARREDRAHRAIEVRKHAHERLVAATLIDAALEVLKYDIDHVRNTFDPGKGDDRFDNSTIEPARAVWLRQRLRLMMVEPVLQYIDKLEHDAVSEYVIIAMTIERVREADTSITSGEFRDLLESVRGRADSLQADVKRQAELARAAIQASS